MKKLLEKIFGNYDERLRERCLRLAHCNKELSISYYSFVKRGYFIWYNPTTKGWDKSEFNLEEALPES